MTTENIDIINEDYQEKLIERELEEIAPIQTDIKEVEKVIPVEKEEAKTVLMEEEQEKDNPSINIIDELPNEEPVGPIGEDETLIVDSTAEEQTILDETPENIEILDEAKEELKDIEPIPEESIENAVAKPSLNIEDTKEAEKIPILTIFMIAYVVFMALLVFCH